MKVTATEAKNRLGLVLEQAQRAPVFIEKAGRRHSVVISAEHSDALCKGQFDKPDARTGKRFYAEYTEWVDEQNRLVEKFGVFGEERRGW